MSNTKAFFNEIYWRPFGAAGKRAITRKMTRQKEQQDYSLGRRRREGIKWN